MYDEMMTSLLRIVLSPQRSCVSSTEQGLWEFVPLAGAVNLAVAADALPSGEEGGVKKEASSWKNLLKWRAFTRKNREKVLAEYA